MEHIVTFILSMAFYMTPILYKPEQVPENLRFILDLNPMTHIINSYRDIFYSGTSPELLKLFIVFLVSILILLIGYHIFERLQRGFAEEV